MNGVQQKRWWVDAALFVGFLICFFVDLTGVSLHQWIGLAGGMLAGYHLASHWKWVQAVSGRFFGKTSGQARWFYLIDAGLLAGFVVMIVTGLAISTWLNLSLASYAAWRTVHIAASIGSLLLVALKIGLHARWVVSIGEKLFGSPVITEGKRSSGVDRRTALKLMGVVGIASLFALSSSLRGLSASQDSEEKTDSSLSTNSLPTNTTLSSNTSSSSCTILCPRRCSYPGHCRRYVDGNANGRCDLGECQS